MGLWVECCGGNSTAFLRNHSIDVKYIGHLSYQLPITVACRATGSLLFQPNEGQYTESAKRHKVRNSRLSMRHNCVDCKNDLNF